MNNSDSSLGKIVRQFLLDPYNNENFNNLFIACSQMTIAYLRCRKAKGYPLPLYESNLQKSYCDLAIDCLDDFFLSTKNQPYYIIFDFFRRHGVTDPNVESDESLGKLMRELLFGFVKKKLARIAAREDPQIANLKRRIKNILNSDIYKSFSDADGNESVCMAVDFDTRRVTAPPLSYDIVIYFAEEAYLHSTNREQWCHKIMEAIARQDEFQNFVSKSDLLRAMIGVNAKYVELGGSMQASIPGPERAMIRDAAVEAKKKTLNWVETEVIAMYVAKKSLTQKEAECFLKAVDNYLSDFVASGGTDSLPDYFREVMPKESHCRYLKDYKNSFETVISKAVEYFKDELKKILQKRGLGPI